MVVLFSSGSFKLIYGWCFFLGKVFMAQ